MQKDKRKSRRRPIRYSAWMELAKDVRHGCLLSDISDTGARLDVDDSNVVPDRFVLWLSSSGAAQRACQVMWRKPTQVGVQFERRFADSDRATLVPHRAAQANTDDVE